MNIGIFGYGVVGQAVFCGFYVNNKIKIYDKYKKGLHSAKDVVDKSEIIFICVPTETINETQDLSNVEECVREIDSLTKNRKVIVIKSTILPGTTRNISNLYPDHGFIFNPEFLTERTSNEDFKNQKQVVLGCKESSQSVDKVKKLYKESLPDIPIEIVSWEIAELLKYTCNTFYSTKITFANQIYMVCKKLNIDYEVIKRLFIANGWVSPTHLDVPGHDKKCGYGGKCFPKDIKAFVVWGEENHIDLSLLKEVDIINEIKRTLR